ncbi:MAG: SsrA-binding protein [Phycisphaerales bacterium]|nr:SsrA-binding protein [Phycisphaerales bacterium]
MAKDANTKRKRAANMEPRIANRKATHDYFIDSKLECGIVLVGSEVKSLRLGKAQLQEAFARVEKGELILHQCHIDQYEKSNLMNHVPLRERKLLAHKREIAKLAEATKDHGVTLVPLAVYFKDGRVKVEIGVGRGKRQEDKRRSIKEKEMKQDVRRAMTRRV